MDEKQEIKKVKEWIIEQIENDLDSWTYPKIEKATTKNIEKAIKQQGNPEKGSGEHYQLQYLKKDLEIFKIIDKWQK